MELAHSEVAGQLCGRDRRKIVDSGAQPLFTLISMFAFCNGFYHKRRLQHQQHEGVRRMAMACQMTAKAGNIRRGS